ncbi:3-phosphoshikimate 1-carboxyvinyltransferase [Nautilia sp. PV-1]|uniref:3-phosphoshikimate 1-carboxyvinyltransferase n=1 Tax=Nautilia sp. PV-1 TaxID=2579250 RepID=UPI000FDC3D16|nr:3-phosphoshikimate 1-carboxyvinyltransferase [Nautilia sp. PV-1]AZV46595.1 3-phosphoshikimate 1-carboxyvinyltransferase [Nautilia sp. PV-1]
MILEVVGGRKFEEEFTVDADKSISHRCAIFSLLTEKENVIQNYLRAEDTLNSLEIAKSLGAEVTDNGDVITIKAPERLQEAEDVLYCGNSGTTIRIYMGLLAGIDGFFVLTGDQYLRKRPMKRVAEPLRSIGAKIDGRKNGDLAPLAVRGGKLKSFNYKSKIASAQVKSAMILAALNADKPSYYEEPILSRDHTERMLKGMGAELNSTIENGKCKIIINPLQKKLNPLTITVPNDPSSAFFFAVAAAITDSTAVIKNVTLNPTRIESYKALEKMGADIEYVLKEDKYEPIGDIIVKGAKLKAIEISENIPWLIDELPALAMAMAVAEGTSTVKNAKELRVKESDRISTVINGLKACEIEAEEFEDGYKITGGIPKKAQIDSHGDHRIAMSFAVLGLLCGMKIDKAESINTSFPNFFKLFAKIADYKVDDDN